MDYRTVGLLAMAVINLVLGAIAFMAVDTSVYLLETNAMLMVPHRPHDVSLTAWHEGDGSILVIVDGQFAHKLWDACSNTDPGGF